VCCMNPVLFTLLLAMVPVGELRGAIPYAIAMGVPAGLALSVAVLGNVLIVPVLFLFLEFIHFRFLHMRHYRSMFDFFMERTRARAQRKVERYGYVGLFLLVAIPLPFTGAYTATIAAWFFGMRKWPAFLAIVAGVIVAGVIVLLLSVGGASAMHNFFIR